MYLMYAIETNGTSFCFSYLRNILDEEKHEKSQLVCVLQRFYTNSKM